MPLWIKTGPNLRVTSWNQRDKDVEFVCGENDSGERSRAIMALLLDTDCIENIVEKGEIAHFEEFHLFSSPEHEVLRVSYCDWSVVRLSVCPY